MCLRWLSARAHTRAELRDKLERKGVPAEIAESVLDRFADANLVNDADFAETWVRSRHEYAGRGRTALAAELRRKGVSDREVDQALAVISDEDEWSRAYALVAQRLERTPKTDWRSNDDRQRVTRKLVGMLSRRGYAPGLAYSVVKQAIADREGVEIGSPEGEVLDSDL